MVLQIIGIVYITAVIVTGVLGIFGMFANAEFGRDDADFKTYKFLFVWSFFPPFAIAKALKNRLDEADGEQ